MIKLLLENAAYIALIGSIITAAGAWMSQYQSQQESNRFESELRQKADTIAQLQASLKDKAEETLNYHTGGNSFPYIYFSDFTESKDRLSFNIYAWNAGSYPLYDVHIFLDPTLAEWENANPRSESQEEFSARGLRLMEPTKTAGPIEFAPNEKKLLGSFDLDKSEKIDFSISMQGRNGHWSQKLRYRKVDDSWVESLIVETNMGDVLLNRKDDGYPQSGS